MRRSPPSIATAAFAATVAAAFVLLLVLSPKNPQHRSDRKRSSRGHDRGRRHHSRCHGHANGRKHSHDHEDENVNVRNPPTAPAVRDGALGLIGHTPLVRIRSLSEATGCDILAKAEFLSLGGSSKDRVARAIVLDAEARGLIAPHSGCVLFEGTVGSTGISLAVVARARGYKCHIVMPDDQAAEKYEALEALGATVERVRPVSIVDADHFVNIARRRALEMNEAADKQLSQDAEQDAGGSTHVRNRGYFCDQFENLANYRAHLTTTGPEIFEQTKGKIDAVVMGAGTGGTLAGLAYALRPRIPNLKVVLADPDGSGLYNKVKYNVLYSSEQAEGTRRRHQVDTIVEGIGLTRITANFSMALDGSVDDAVRVTDREAVEMSRHLMREDGLFVGSSSSVNCVAAYRIAKRLGTGHTIVTILCDHGSRHMTKFWNAEYVARAGLAPTANKLDDFL